MTHDITKDKYAHSLTPKSKSLPKRAIVIVSPPNDCYTIKLSIIVTKLVTKLVMIRNLNRKRERRLDEIFFSPHNLRLYSED